MPLATLTRAEAIPLVGYVLDDSLAVYRDTTSLLPSATLVGWQCRKQPFFIGVQSYLSETVISQAEASDIAIDFLTELGWFEAVGLAALAPDYVFVGEPVP